MAAHRDLPTSVEATLELLEAGDYVADRELATALFLALELQRPLLLEGAAGVGKTDLATVLARMLGRRLVRLQCYEGLDASAAIYEWDFAAQMVEIRLAEHAESADREALASDVFSERFLIKRPLLQALESDTSGAPILLIDEIDRADPPFEAFLLEILSDFQVTIPETGTVHAAERPIVVITSNRTREVHDALKRRCIYHWIGYPDAAQERAILDVKMPGVGERLSAQIETYIREFREGKTSRVGSVREAVEWSTTLVELDRVELDPKTLSATIDVLVKYQRELAEAKGGDLGALVEKIRADLPEEMR